MADDSPRLYVGNLPYVAQKHDIEQLFENNKITIKNIDMSIDPFTGRNPSYCFVDFHDLDTAQRVLDTMQGLNVRGRPIRINRKTERRQGGSQRPETRTYDRGWKPRDLPSRDADPETAYAFDRWNRDDAQSHWIAPLEERRRLWVGGLPRIPNQDSLNVEMRELFADYHVEAVSKLISPHHSEQSSPGSHYACFVDLANATEAKNAVTMFHGVATPYGGTYTVSLAGHTRRKIVEREQLGTTSKLFVGALPSFESHEALATEIRQVFDGHNVKWISHLRTPHETKFKDDGKHNYCYVDLGSGQAAQAAVENLDGKELPSGAVYKIRIARERVPPQSGHDGKRWRQQETESKRNLGGNWRGAA